MKFTNELQHMLNECPTPCRYLSVMPLCKDAFYYCWYQRDLSVHLLIVAKQYMKEIAETVYPPTLTSYCSGSIARNVKDN